MAGHDLAQAGHRLARFDGESFGIAGCLGLEVLEGDADREVRERVVRAGLVGDDVNRRAADEQLGKYFSGVADDAHRECLTRVLCRNHARHGRIEVGRVFVEVTVLDPAREARLVDIDDQHRSPVHGDGQWLRTAHAAASARQRQSAGQIVSAQ